MPEPIMGLCTLVLAAGQGSRYRELVDQDKLLAPSRDTPAAPGVLASTLESLAGITERLVVVTREDNLAIHFRPLHHGLACNACIRILGQTGIEDCIGDGVTEFVGMSSRDRLRGKQQTFG